MAATCAFVRVMVSASSEVESFLESLLRSIPGNLRALTAMLRANIAYPADQNPDWLKGRSNGIDGVST